MKLKDWIVEIAPCDETDKSSMVVSEAIWAFILLFGDQGPENKPIDYAKSIIPPPNSAKKLMIIPSTASETALQQALKKLLILAYRQYEENVGLQSHRFLFFPVGSTSIYYEGLRRILGALPIGVTARSYKLLPSLVEILDEETGDDSQRKADPITSLRLQRAIENNGFPSGASEMLELRFRAPSRFHKIRGQIPQKKEYAIRLLFGAFAAGDVSKGVVCSILKEIIDADGDGWTDVENWLTEICCKQKELQTELKLYDSERCRLSEYLRGKHILFIEDLLIEQSWDVVLPAILNPDHGSHQKIEKETPCQKFDAVTITHVKTAQDAIDYYGDQLHQYDIILLDLYSSLGSTQEDKEHPPTSITISESVRALTDKVRKLYDKETENPNGTEADKRELVPASLPRIVVFSKELAGISTRTMLKELGASDYFFKLPEGEAHKGAYYCSFRNALITALKENIAHILSIPTGHGQNRFDRWFEQFLPADRPLILRIMKYFRYYSAMSIVNAIDTYLLDNMRVQDEGIISIRGSNSSPIRVYPKQLWFSYLGRPNKSAPATLSLISKTKWLGQCKHHLTTGSKHDKTELRNLLPQFKSYETLQEELAKKFVQYALDEEKDTEPLIVILVDDFIGSSGQLKSYLEKFLTDENHLRAAIQKQLSDCESKKPFEEVWETSCEILTGRTDFTLELHALYAVGVKNGEFERLFSDGPFTHSKDGNVKMPQRTICGQAKVDLNSGGKVPYHVHVADYTYNLYEICEAVGINFCELVNTLMNYVFITNPRAKEYPCDFEVLGWKNCGSLVATYANAQGNTLPIIWADGGIKPWTPLFQRFFNPWDEGDSWREEKLECKADPNDCKLFSANPNRDALVSSLKKRGLPVGKDSCWCKANVIKS